jgi:hypothetical protein
VIAVAVLTGAPREGREPRDGTAQAAARTESVPTLPPGLRSGSAARCTPLVFEENVGQFHRDARFRAVSRGFQAWFADGEVVLDGSAGEEHRDVLRMRVAGTDVAPSADALLPGTSNYFLGNDRTRWVTGAPHRAGVTYSGVAPGVDLAWRSSDRAGLEYVVTAAPGADAELLEISFDGAVSLELTRAGDLVVATPHGEFRHARPVAWQETGAGRRAVACRFDVRGSDRLGFRIGAHDPARELVIDPTVTWATYFGGSWRDWGGKIAVDSAGAAYVVGITSSTDFPTVGAVQTTRASEPDAFVAKINAAGSAVLYSTYIGGTGTDRLFDVVVDANGAATCAGQTSSTDFPTQSPYQSSNAGGLFDLVVVRLSVSGSTLAYATYLGGTARDDLGGLRIDSSGATYVAGHTESIDYPTVSAYSTATWSGAQNPFVTKIAASGTSLTYSTFLGGTGFCEGLALDASGAAVVTGWTYHSAFPTVGAFQTSNARSQSADAFISKIGVAGNTLVWSSTLGGTGNDRGKEIAVDGSGVVYVAGITDSTDFPTTSGAMQAGNASSGAAQVWDGFVTKIASDGSQVVWSTYYGGSGGDVAEAIAPTSEGSVWIGGSTKSSDLPLQSPLQPSFAGGTDDAFLAHVNSSGTALRFATYLGGSSALDGSSSGESVTGLVATSDGSVLATGSTPSSSFSVSSALQSASGGAWDAFMLKLAPAVPEAPTTFTATPLNDRSVRLDWSGGVQEGGNFEVERAPAGGAFARIATPASTAATVTDTALTGETAYDYRLRGTNISGTSAWTSSVRVTTGPNAPQSLTATAQTNTRVALGWTDRSSAETSFQVERRAGAAGAWARIATTGANVGTFTDPAAPPESTSEYRVRAANAIAPSEWTSVVRVTTPPANPGARTPANLPAGSAHVSWNDTSLAEKGYELQRAPGSPGTQWTTIALLPPNATGFEDAAVTPESTFSYRVRAFNDFGASDWVSLGSLTTAPFAPTDLAAEALSPTRVAVSWTDLSQAETGYEVLRSDDGVFVPVADLPANATGVVEGSLSQETGYTYRVRTFNQHGKSPWAEVAVTTPSALVVKSVKIKRGRGKRPKPTVLTATGEFDAGGTGIDLGAAATIIVGESAFDLSGLSLVKGVHRFTNDVLTLDLVPARTGQSRVTFRLTLKGAAADALDPDGETVLRYRNGPFDASGVVALTGGGFAIGRDRLVDPSVVVSGFAATLRGKGRDSLKVSGWFDASGDPPAQAPDVTVRLDGYEFVARGTGFEAAGDRRIFSLRASAGGVTLSRKVVLDWAKGTVQVTLLGVDLGEFEQGAVPVTFSLEVGSGRCTDTFVAACKGKSLRY